MKKLLVHIHAICINCSSRGTKYEFSIGYEWDNQVLSVERMDYPVAAAANFFAKNRIDEHYCHGFAFSSEEVTLSNNLIIVYDPMTKNYSTSISNKSNAVFFGARDMSLFEAQSCAYMLNNGSNYTYFRPSGNSDYTLQETASLEVLWHGDEEVLEAIGIGVKVSQ